MALYQVDGGNKIVPVRQTTFAQEGMQGRKHLQILLKSRPQMISPDTLIIAEEFSNWEDSWRRIDLLGIDKSANLVVIELKRTEDGGHMELQAIRYAAMISTMTFDALVSCYDQYLKANNDEGDARKKLLEFLGWDDSDDQMLGQKIRIVLASAEFSKELTASVLWLNDQGLDIRCIRIRPYHNDKQLLLDVQTIIPAPEANTPSLKAKDYQVKIRRERKFNIWGKRKWEQAAREITRESSRFDVTIGEERYPNLNKRDTIFWIVSAILKNGGSPDKVIDALPSKRLRIFEGILSAKQVRERLMEGDPGGKDAAVQAFLL